MKCVFGVDGGGTSSRLRIEALDGEKLFYAEGGSTNPNSNEAAAIRGTLADLFLRAREEAGIAVGDLAAGFVGSAGVDREADREAFSAILREATGFAGTLGVGNDAEPALAGALGDTEGLLLIAGTGSIAFGRARDGSTVRSGGWGHLLGDEGSAWRIAFDAICRGLRSSEGRDLESGLLEAALAYFGLSRAEDFIPFVYGGIDKKRIAGFARVVGDFRDRGDALALDLFDKAAHELAALVESVYSRIASRLERKRLAFRGGLVESDLRLSRNLSALIASKIPELELVPPAADAARGACILARSLVAAH